MKKRLLCLLLTLMTILSLVPTAWADEVSASDIKGDGNFNSTVTFYVKTGSKWKSSDYIKLEGTKGTLRAGTWSVSTEFEEDMPQSDELYGYYHVDVWKKSGNDWEYQSKLSENCWDDSSHTIKKLKKNTEYKISVKGYSEDEICNIHWIKYSASILSLFGNAGYRLHGGDAQCVNIKWSSGNVPTWSIAKTKGSCTYSM